MEKESNISLDGTIILLALLVQKYIFGQKNVKTVLESESCPEHFEENYRRKYTPLHEKDAKNQKSPMETTSAFVLLELQRLKMVKAFIVLLED